MTKTIRRHEIQGNMGTGLLKVLALAFMFIDHAGKMCFPGIGELRLLGRIAFPLYCWCMVVGACYTRSFPKYLLRIGLVGLISQPLYMVALNHPITQYNIFLTMFVALCGLWGMRQKKFYSHIWAPVLALIAAHLLGVDYGWRGVMLVFLLYGARNSRTGIAAVMVAYCLFWGNSSNSVTSLFGLPLTPIYRSKIGGLISPFMKVQGFALLALPFLLIRTDRRIRIPTWLGYGLYPAHLALLIGLQYLMNKPIHWEHVVNVWNDLTALIGRIAAVI